MKVEITGFDNSKLIKTFDRWKQASFFFDKYKEALTPFEKYNYLSAAIVYTRSIYHVLEHELKRMKLAEEAINDMNDFFKNPSFAQLNATRNLEIKEKIDPSEMPVWFYPKIKSFTGKVKFVLQFVEGNKVKILAYNFDTNEPLELESDLVDYNIEIQIQLRNDGEKTVIQINKLLEETLDDWLRFLKELSTKLP